VRFDEVQSPVIGPALTDERLARAAAAEQQNNTRK